jgi:hypothetical protein
MLLNEIISCVASKDINGDEKLKIWNANRVSEFSIKCGPKYFSQLDRGSSSELNIGFERMAPNFWHSNVIQ